MRRAALCLLLLLGGCPGNPGAADGALVSPEVDRPPDQRLVDARPDLPTTVPGSYVKIAAGSFEMGSPAEEACRDADEDLHEVTITRAFELGEREVTQAEFRSVMGFNPSFQTGCDDCPVEWVTWHEAATYCNALSLIAGLVSCYGCHKLGEPAKCGISAGGAPKITACPGYRLPTEAEWEYAARAGSTTAVPGGAVTSCMGSDERADALGWYKANSDGVTHPVGQKAKNAWGLHDLTGNVYEWVNDLYQAKLGTAPAVDPVGPGVGGQRVFRGGAWYFNAEHLRSAKRLRFAPEKRFTFLGFRCARTLP